MNGHKTSENGGCSVLGKQEGGGIIIYCARLADAYYTLLSSLFLLIA